MNPLRLLVPLALSSSLVVSAAAGTFETARRVAVGTAPSAIGVGDFNHDGKLDIVVCNNQDSSVGLLLGNGDGTFKSQKSFALDGPPIAIAVGDFNRDGNLDVAVVTTDLFILLGNGDGTLRFGEIVNVGDRPGSIVAADFNRDGKLDLAIMNLGANILLGNGDGTFQSPVNYAAGYNSVGVATGDFNRDGKPDLVVSNVDPNGGFSTVEVLLGDGKGAFGSAIETGNLMSGGTPFVGDFNGDGRLDVAAGNMLLLGDGKGMFSSPQYIGLPYDVFGAVGDFNGDRKLDLVSADSAFDDVAMYSGNGKGQFASGPTYAAGAGTFSMAIGDFNGDGHMDLAVAGANSNDITVMINQGSKSFFAARDFSGAGPVNNPAAAIVGDFNGDGKPDVLTNNWEGSAYLVLGKGNGAFAAPIDLQLIGIFLVAADFNGDGKLDFATFASFYPSTSNVTVALGNGDGTFQQPQNYFAGYGIAWLTLGDFNGDGKLDLAVSAGKFVVVLLGKGDGTFQSPIDTALASTVGPSAIGDFNGDGKLDLAVTNGANITILFGNGDGSFRKGGDFPAGSGPFYSITAGDFNGDGRPDLAVADYYGNSVNVLLGEGKGKFGKAIKNNVGTKPLSVLTDDFNMDGKLDIAATASGANAFVLFGKGNGTFRPAAQIGSGQGNQVAKGDLNRDGRPDLVSAGVGGLTVLLNVTKKDP